MSQLTVRHIEFKFPETIDRFWLGNDPFRTHLLNTLTLLLPDAEKYIIRTMKPELEKIEDPKLKQDVSKFVGQEGQHSTAHTKFWHNLKNQGYQVDGFLQLAAFVINDVFEKRLSQSLNLATTAGFEHLTECISELALKQNFLAQAPPQLKLLFEWHAAEELEHKTVTYDVLRTSTSNYLIRFSGLVISHVFFVVFLGLGLLTLLSQDRKILDLKVWQAFFSFMLIKEKFAPRIIANFVDYLRIDFHPSQRNNQFLCQQVFEGLKVRS